MVFFNYSTMQMAAKVVYYGPGLCGKTTNLQWIFEHTSNDSRGEMVSLATETDRTLFFDLLPIDVGSIAGFSTRIQLYTVPGQVFYNTTRKLVLKGVDGVVFVADSQRPMLQANIESFENLEENLGEMGLSLDTIPVVLQYNKRDLSNILSVEELDEALNPGGNWHSLEASALNGDGVFETLKTISKATLLALKKRLTKGRPEGGGAKRPAPPSPARPAPRPAPAPPAAKAPEPSTPVEAAPPAPEPVPIEPEPIPIETAPEPEPIPIEPEPEPIQLEPAAPVELDVEPPTTPVQTVAPTPAPTPEPAPAPAPEPVAAAPAPAPAAPAQPSPAPVAPAQRKKRKKDKGTGPFDALAELEKLRQQTLRPKSAKAAAASVNGQREIQRSLDLDLKRDSLARARRFSLTLQLQDADHQGIDEARELHVDLEDASSLDQLLLKLDIALRTTSP
jgi:hypothetical protein